MMEEDFCLLFYVFPNIRAGITDKRKTETKPMILFPESFIPRSSSKTKKLTFIVIFSWDIDIQSLKIALFIKELLENM